MIFDEYKQSVYRHIHIYIYICIYVCVCVFNYLSHRLALCKKTYEHAGSSGHTKSLLGRSHGNPLRQEFQQNNVLCFQHFHIAPKVHDAEISEHLFQILVALSLAMCRLKLRLRTSRPINLMKHDTKKALRYGWHVRKSIAVRTSATPLNSRPWARRSTSSSSPSQTYPGSADVRRSGSSCRKSARGMLSPMLGLSSGVV